MAGVARAPPPSWFGLPPRIAAGFGAALVSIVVAAVASYAALTARGTASRFVRHTTEARHAVEELEGALLVSRTALDAALASEDPRHRELFAGASSRLRPAADVLRGLAEQHPERKPRVGAILADVGVVDAEHARVRALLEVGDLRAARAIAASGGGRQALERATRALERLEAEETVLHAGREAAWRRSVLVSNTIFFAALSVLLALVAVAARLVRNEITKREAEAAARERAILIQRRIVGMVSHDLRSPLTAILTAGGALARAGVPGTQGALARRVVTAAGRMERLIRDLLDWSRIEAGAELPITPVDADLADVCRRMADEVSDREGSPIEVVAEGDTRAALDPARLEQVVGNLVSNACRHGRPGGPVRVRAVGAPGEVRVEVENEGPEIPAAARAEIFEPFRQGPAGHKGGVGLGLFIVRALVEAHGGTVEVRSGAGKTTFLFRLPRLARPAEEASRPAGA